MPSESENFSQDEKHIPQNDERTQETKEISENLSVREKSSPKENNESTDTETIEDVVVISANSAFDGHKLKNFYMTNAFQGFVWMIFHF